MFHPRLVIDQNILIIGTKSAQDISQQIIGIAVAAWSFGSPHGNKVKTGRLHKAGLDFVFEELLFRHPAWQFMGRSLRLFPDNTDGLFELYSEHIV